MRATGIVRSLDELGRVVIPAELRRVMDLQTGAAVEIFTEGETVLLRLYQPLCVFCGNGGIMIQHHEKRVCETCRAKLSGSLTHS